MKIAERLITMTKYIIQMAIQNHLEPSSDAKGMGPSPVNQYLRQVSYIEVIIEGNPANTKPEPANIKETKSQDPPMTEGLL